MSSRLLVFLVILACAPVGHAQDGSAASSDSGASSSSNSAGASSAFGAAPASPSPSADFGAPTPSNPAVYQPPVSAGSSASGFGTGIGTGTAAQSGQPAGTEIPGAAGGARTQESPTSFSISTGYGRTPEVFVSGEGRLARPRFITRVSGSIGFDDNIFQTPTRARGTDQVVVREQITTGSPEQVYFVVVPNTGPKSLSIITRPQAPTIRRVVIPAVEPEFRDIVIPGTPKAKRQVSAISRESFSFEAQLSSKRTVFTADFSANADYYWNRPKNKSEYNGSLALRYLHRFTPRLQVTASVDASYLSQPDLTQINTPVSVGAGNYLTINAKADISYRWTPRISTVTSLSYDQLSYDEAVRQLGDYRALTIGTELRYLWSPRITAVLEGRYSATSYPNSSGLDASTIFALTGFELSLSRRASASVRVGAAIRSFDNSTDGGSSTAPYLEATANYQLSRSSVLSWSNRFGFEDPPSPTSEVLSYRTGVSVTHFFGPRLRGSLGVDAIFRRTTDDAADTETNETTLDSNLSLLYTLTRAWTFNLNYTYIASIVDPGSSDYFRNRIFAGFDYSF